MKFKLGDKVRVKDNGLGSSNKPITTKCRGRVGKIVTVALINIAEYGYELDIAPNYYWSADSLEPYEEGRDARRYKVGDRVIAVDNVGAHPKGAPGRIVCIFNDHPDDKEFDYMVSYDDGQGALWSNIVCLEGEKVPVASPALSFVSPPVHGKQSEMEREMRYPFIAITCNGRKTKAVLKCGDKVLRRASASCNPEDDFDQYVGARIALDRLFDRPVDIDAHEHTEHPAMPKPFEGKAVCVNKNEAHPVSKRFTIGKVYEFKDERISGDNGFQFMTASSLDGNWTVLGAKFIPFIGEETVPKRYSGTIVCVESEEGYFTLGKAYRVAVGCLRDDYGCMMLVDSDTVEGINNECNDIGTKFVELVE